MVAVLPLSFVHTVVLIVAPPFPVAFPLKLIVFVGSLIVWELPALTLGAIFVEFTQIVSEAVAVAPRLSFTVSLKIYVPCIIPLAVVDTAALLPIVAVEGPESWVQP